MAVLIWYATSGKTRSVRLSPLKSACSPVGTHHIDNYPWPFAVGLTQLKLHAHMGQVIVRRNREKIEHGVAGCGSPGKLTPALVS